MSAFTVPNAEITEQELNYLDMFDTLSQSQSIFTGSTLEINAVNRLG